MSPTLMRTVALLLSGLLLSTTSARAENWPGWRGPRGDGTSAEEHVPTHWNGPAGENIAWKVEVPGDGHASPVVWDDRIFLVSCLPESQERVLMCLGRRTGETLWERTVVTSPLETLHKLNSRASGTPVTDGRLVYVNFLEVDGTTVPAPNVGAPRPITPGRVVVAAYDFDGNRQWITRVGEFISAHGFCSCPVLYENFVIINGDHDGQSYITALHKETGETAWKVPRANGIRSYVTPLIRTVGGRTQMVLSGSKHIASLDPRDGSTLWTVDGPTEQFVASMVFDGERFFMAAGFPDYHVMAIRGEGSGDVTHSQVAWHSTEAHCYVPSPVVVDGYLLVANDDGIAHCYQADTGEHLWKTRLGRHYSASLVTAGGLVYFTDDDGVTKLIRPGNELDIVAENGVDEPCFASPAISWGQLFIRSEHHLFCIGPREGT